jgi:hypothetical protein
MASAVGPAMLGHSDSGSMASAPIPDSRFPIPDSRFKFPIPDSRFPIPDSRLPSQGGRESAEDHPTGNGPGPFGARFRVGRSRPGIGVPGAACREFKFSGLEGPLPDKYYYPCK